MSAKLPSIIPDQSKWYPIDLGAGQLFEIQIRRPTFAEQVKTLAIDSPESHTKSRMEAMITDWRGVEDDSDPPRPVKFSSENLLQMIQVYPQSFRQITTALNDMFHVWPGDLEKNLPTPPANGGTITTVETTASTESSNSGSSSEVESASGRNLDAS